MLNFLDGRFAEAPLQLFLMLPPLSVVIPAFNEAIRIGETLRATINYLENVSPTSELIVVNDGSTDRTGEVLRKVLGEHGSVRSQLLENFPNRGKGAAVRTGLLAANQAIAVFSDADLSTPIDELPKIVDPIVCRKADLTFGSRALNRSLIGNRQPWRREQAGRVFNLFVRAITGLPFWDTQCGFKAFNMELCRPIIEEVKIEGFGFDVELLYLARHAGLRLLEIPVRWNHHDGSKVNFLHDSWRMLREVVALHSGARSRTDRIVLPARTS